MIQRLQDIYYDTEKRTLMRRTQNGTEIILFPEGQQPAIEAVADPTVLTVPKPKLGGPELAAAFIRIKAKILGVDITDSCEIQASGTGITGHFGVGTEHNLFTLTALASEDTILAVNVSHPTYGSISLNVPVKCYLWPVTDLVTEYIETRHKRSTTQPETPVGDNPAGWAVAPPAGTIALWSSIAQRKGDGTLLTAWSTPERVTGVDGAAGAPGKTYYFAYHDNPYTSTPATPTGDGVTDGWHSALTSSSVWVSVKFAVNRSDADAWSTPTVQAAIESIPLYAPKYLGTFESAPTSNFNRGDWYLNLMDKQLYLRESNSWTTNGITTRHKTAALSDLLALGAQNDASTFIESLIANEALINKIGTRHINVEVLNGLIANLSQYLQISDRGFVSSTKPDPFLEVGDRRVYIDKDELAIQTMSGQGTSLIDTFPNGGRRLFWSQRGESTIALSDNYVVCVTYDPTISDSYKLQVLSRSELGQDFAVAVSYDLPQSTYITVVAMHLGPGGQICLYYKGRNEYSNYVCRCAMFGCTSSSITLNATKTLSGYYSLMEVDTTFLDAVHFSNEEYCIIVSKLESTYLRIGFMITDAQGNGGGFVANDTWFSYTSKQVPNIWYNGETLYVYGSKAVWRLNRVTTYLERLAIPTNTYEQYFNPVIFPLSPTEAVIGMIVNWAGTVTLYYYKAKAGVSLPAGAEWKSVVLPTSSKNIIDYSMPIRVGNGYYWAYENDDRTTWFVYLDYNESTQTFALAPTLGYFGAWGVLELAQGEKAIFITDVAYATGSQLYEYADRRTWADELVLGRNGAGLTYKNTVIGDGDIALSGISVKDAYVRGTDSRATTNITGGTVGSVVRSGFYACSDAVTDLPTNAFYDVLHVQSQTEGYAHQLAFLTSVNKIYARFKSAGSWGFWAEITPSGANLLLALSAVDGAGSGLDADTLDGKHANELGGTVDIVGLAACTDPDVVNDDLLIYDASAAVHKKVKPSQIQPTSVGYATKAGDGAASSNIRIPTSQPTSLANGDIWLV